MRTTELSSGTGIDRTASLLRFRPTRWIDWFLTLAFVLSAVLAQAEGFRYRYVSLDDKAPPGFAFFFPGGINDSGRVYGTASDATGTNNHIAFYEDGAVTVLPPSGFAGPVNARGTVGGAVLLDPLNFLIQAALFRDDETELIPPHPGELFSFVQGLNDRDTALVESVAASGQLTYVLYSKGQATPIDFGGVLDPLFFSSKVINNRGIIAGTTHKAGGNIFEGGRGFRFDTRTGELAILDPVESDANAWGVAINRRGEVLGYSFVGFVTPVPYHERVGVWDRKGHFHTYFFETISSNRLLFNDNNLIVITLAPGSNSYLVPRPGVRLNLADLVENLPFGEHLSFIFDMNNHGDLLGFGTQHTFLLKRIDDSDGSLDDE